MPAGLASPTRPRAHVVIAAAMALSVVAFLAAAYALLLAVPWPSGVSGPALWFDLVFSGLILSFGATGTLLAARVPRNPLGWIMAGVGLTAAIAMAGGTYAGYNVQVAHGTAPLGDFVSWVGNWLFQPGLIVAVIYIPLLFPSGRLPSRRWRIFAWFGVWAISMVTLNAAFGPWGSGQYPGTPNPYEVHGRIADALAILSTVANVTGPPALLIVLGSLVLRFRRARGVEREQLKWFAYAGVLAIASQFASNLTPQPYSDALFEVGLVIVDLIPVAIAIAILRYRLYDIDVVINRTLVYGLLVAVLGAVYAVSVLTLETVLSPVTQTSSLSVAVSTLVVAALFDPVRRRVRAIVDRRFYRRRYDAAREIAGFGSRLRDEVEPDRVLASIATTLERTVEPAFSSIWLRSPARR